MAAWWRSRRRRRGARCRFWSRAPEHLSFQRTRRASGTGSAPAAGSPGCCTGSGAALALILVWLDAAIAAPPRHKRRPTAFPRLHPCRGPTGIFAPATEGHGATLTAPADLRRPISCKSVSARLHPGLRNGLAGFYASPRERGYHFAECMRPDVRPACPPTASPRRRSGPTPASTCSLGAVALDRATGTDRYRCLTRGGLRGSRPAPG